ncbi:MAG TPA: succinic semialdehyde dehydrogenase, partial [Longimicrobiales bacterium]|nr:succinic semialdehyde dehydrogenase [Longimicrobiales bacterium]
RQDEILDLVQVETGKARRDAFEELFDAANVARYYARTAKRHLRPRRRRGLVPGLTSAWELRHPVGVVGVIAPWNYPLTLAVSDALPALVAGNGVVLKPDPQASFTALWCLCLLYEAGLPGELFQVVTGDGPETGAALLDAVDYVAFTGSTATGRIVAARAGERLIGCSLELGGKNPMVVMEDADLERAARGAARGCFANAGQLCISTERILVQASVHDAFLERLLAATAELRLGRTLDFDADVGSLTSPEQLEKVERHVADAVEKGARVLVGGRRRPELGPLFYEPTLLAEVTPAMTVCHEETFGPVASLYRFGSAEEALAMANDTEYGLNASVWTEDLRFGRRMAARIRAGTVAVNDAYGAAWGSVDAPMGGMKASGLGRRHGAQGIHTYTESQTVAVQRGMALAAPPGLGEERYSRVASSMLRVMRRVPRD